MNLPNNSQSFNLIEFIGHRTEEICNLLAVVDNSNLPKGEVSQGPRTFVQRLPRHLRRRAMSHNPKRLPRRARTDFALSQTKETKHIKPPSRFHRRRPSNLLKEYVRRQRNGVWLETHIWHAKRFHMTRKWGYRMSERSAGRGLRASHRDMAKHCLVNDISYTCCIQLQGPEDVICQHLRKLTSPDLGPTFRQYAALKGVCRGSVVLYEHKLYPRGCIGSVEYMWRPIKPDDTNRCMWIWCHPSIHSQLITVLVHVFDLTAQPATVEDTCVDQQNDNKSVAMHAPKLISPPVFVNEQVILTDLKDKMFVLRVSGPLSSELMAKFDGRMRSYNPATLPNGFILPLNVRDPRLMQRSTAKVKLVALGGDGMQDRIDDVDIDVTQLNALDADSGLWDSNVRRTSLDDKMSDKDLNKKREQLFGGDPEQVLGVKMCHVPVIIVSRCSPTVGWDIIGPVGWAMSFWIKMQMHTARAAGQRELRSMALHANSLLFPCYWPDTQAGKLWQSEFEQELLHKFNARPYNRRVDYQRLHIAYPFSFPWSQLFASESQSVFVCRDRKLLKQLDLAIKKPKDANLPVFPSGALIPIKIEVNGRGVPKRRAIVCLPNEEDVHQIQNGHSVVEPIENEEIPEAIVSLSEEEIPLDSLFIDMKVVREEKRKCDKKAGRKRSKSNKIGQNIEEHWENDEVQFTKSCAREILGLIVQGDFALGHGLAKGLGYCSIHAINRLINTESDFVLFRNSTSKYYHLARITVLFDFC